MLSKFAVGSMPRGLRIRRVTVASNQRVASWSSADRSVVTRHVNQAFQARDVMPGMSSTNIAEGGEETSKSSFIFFV